MDNRRMNRGSECRCGCIGIILGYVLAVVLLVMLFASCTRTVYEPVEAVRSVRVEADTAAIYERLRAWFESTRLNEVSRDSVIDRLNEVVVLKENGDTARHDRERIVYVSSRREKVLEHELLQRDSVIEALRLQLESVKVDSIPVPFPVVRELTWWENTKMDFGGMAIGGVFFAFCIVVVWLIKKFRK